MHTGYTTNFLSKRLMCLPQSVCILILSSPETFQRWKHKIYTFFLASSFCFFVGSILCNIHLNATKDTTVIRENLMINRPSSLWVNVSLMVWRSDFFTSSPYCEKKNIIRQGCHMHYFKAIESYLKSMKISFHLPTWPHFKDFKCHLKSNCVSYTIIPLCAICGIPLNLVTDSRNLIFKTLTSTQVFYNIIHNRKMKSKTKLCWL